MMCGKANFHTQSLVEYIKKVSKDSFTKLIKADEDRVVVFKSNEVQMSPYETDKQKEIFFGILSDMLVKRKALRHSIFQYVTNKWREANGRQLQ